jgi:hypothetical protein
MNPKDFLEKLNSIQELMSEEKYSEAIKILDKLKNLEKSSDIDYHYDLIHRLYQLDSNCRSAFHQQVILKFLKNISIKRKSITFKKLNQELREKGILVLNEEILRREIELLILRNQLYCKIDEDTIIL